MVCFVKKRLTKSLPLDKEALHTEFEFIMHINFDIQPVRAYAASAKPDADRRRHFLSRNF